MDKKLKKKSFLEQISTMPNPDSFFWAGTQFSLLATVLLWIMWLCRVFSLLQWVKFIYRKAATAWLRLTQRKDQSGEKNGSGRVNVPPLLCEIYYLLWTVFFALLYTEILSLPHRVIQLIASLFLFESIVWVLYYTIFRRFFEAQYSIYHELEYLSLLILVIPTQALCFSLCYGKSFVSMLAGLLGAGGEDTPFLVTVLGVIVTAIVVSMIISAFPTEKVKKYTPKSKMLILGNGDVVTARLLPVLKKLEDEGEIHSIHTLPAQGDPDPDENSIEPYCQLIRDNLDQRSIVWIETPTYTHVEYLTRILEMPAELIVLEKPITASLTELTKVEKRLQNTGVRNRIFFLNYYLLEKALPLVWLRDQNNCYIKYLDIDSALPREDWQARLGRLKELEIQISEGEDNREWAFDQRYGGQWLETFIHNVQLASYMLGTPYTWEQICYTVQRNKNKLDAYKKGTEIHLLQEKKALKNERFLKARYENGRIYVNLEEQHLELTLNGAKKPYSIRVSEEWTGKYSVMADLVLRVKRGQVPVQEADGLYDELAVNRWLLEQLEQEAEATVSGT